jgi:excisionase family DNA binding protein
VDPVPTLYTAEEAAHVLRVRRSWLERQAAARKIPFTMLGGSYRFTAAHLDQIVCIFESLPAETPRTTQRIPAPRTRAQSTVSPRAEVAQPLRPRPRRQQVAA